MSTKYDVTSFQFEEKNALIQKFGERLLYEERADINGYCIKIPNEDEYSKDRWEQNFYSMSAHVRSERKIISLRSTLILSALAVHNLFTILERTLPVVSNLCRNLHTQSK